MSKFIYSFGIILFGLSLGYMIQILVRRERIRLPIDIDALRILLQRMALLLLNPVAVVGAIWVVSLKNATKVYFHSHTGNVFGLYDWLRENRRRSAAQGRYDSFLYAGSVHRLDSTIDL